MICPSHRYSLLRKASALHLRGPMTDLIMLVLVTALPGAQLSDSVESRHIALLSDVNRGTVAGLLSDSGATLQPVSRGQLVNELLLLEQTPPPMASPIVLMATGSALAIAGLSMIALPVVVGI